MLKRQVTPLKSMSIVGGIHSKISASFFLCFIAGDQCHGSVNIYCLDMFVKHGSSSPPPPPPKWQQSPIKAKVLNTYILSPKCKWCHRGVRNPRINLVQVWLLNVYPDNQIMIYSQQIFQAGGIKRARKLMHWQNHKISEHHLPSKQSQTIGGWSLKKSKTFLHVKSEETDKLAKQKISKTSFTLSKSSAREQYIWVKTQDLKKISSSVCQVQGVCVC